MKSKLLFSLVVLFSSFSSYSQGVGGGGLGDQNISGIINQYASVSIIDTNSPYFTKFKVDDPTGFVQNDLVLVIQMQGAIIDSSNSNTYGIVLDYGNAGHFEYTRLDSVIGNYFFTCKLSKQYDLGGRIQIVKVPQYNNANITGMLTGMPWNGTKGGVIAMDALHKVTLNANIDASGLGFRGGVPSNAYLSSISVNSYFGAGPDSMAMKGEGIAGRGANSITKIAGRGAPANGGGGGNNHNGGGGGGSNLGPGGFGGYGNYSFTQVNSRGEGGHPLGAADVAFMGGGGGAGHANDNFLAVPGKGGGIVLISADSIINAGNDSIKANGGNSPGINGYDGSAGGGGGGSVLLYSNENVGLKIYCLGGKGGNAINFLNGHPSAPGGGGGGGFVWSKYNLLSSSNTFVLDGGQPGICDTTLYGATPGFKGGANIGLNMSMQCNIPISTSVNTNQTNNSDEFSVYPNPCSNYVIIKNPINNNLPITIEIIDLLGKKVFEQTCINNSLYVNTSELHEGTYIVRLYNAVIDKHTFLKVK